MNITDYESLTVVELRQMADQIGVEIPSDARKADIIEALAAAAPKSEPAPEKTTESLEGKEVFNYTTSSTVTDVQMDSEAFRKLKLTS